MEVVQTIVVFDCAACSKPYKIRSARVQADGTLQCPNCSEAESFRWCPQCQQAKPWERFENVRHFARLGRAEWCLECASVVPAVRPATSCDHCGTEFEPARSDARFCSGRCRVAAHRAAASKKG